MNKTHEVKGKNRWILGVILVLTLVVNGSILHDVHAAEYTAAIGTVNYITLDEAIAAVANGETIRLLTPVTISKGIENGIVNRPGVAFFLDLGGQVVSGEQKEAILQVTAGSVTLYNGQIINNLPGGLAVSAVAGTGGKVAFPIGYQKPEPMGAQLILPSAYHLSFAGSTNGTIRYGSPTGSKIPLLAGNLFAAQNVEHHFYFVPDLGYKVDKFTINGVTQPTNTQYDISNMTQDESIIVSFKKITFAIVPKAYANNTVAKLGVFLSPSSATVEYGGSQTFTYTVRKGFQLLDVLVNNVSIGPVTTIELKNVTTPQNIKIILNKTALFIMLDAGHYINYNHSPVLASYYEGNAMWTYHKYLKQSLEQYPNIIVDTTRPDNSREIGSALGPWERGAMGEGYDLMLSVHSNAASTSSADHPVAICTLDPRYSAVSKGLGTKLATKVAEIMKTNETAKIYTKAQSDGQDWYGINRGATSVGVPSIILEHSFHTNYRSTVWLSQDANLRALAVAEAKVIADYYGISPAPVTPVPAVTPPATPLRFAISHISYNSLKLSWDVSQDATGYEVYRSTSSTTGFVKIATTTTNYFTNSGLISGKAYYYQVRAYRTVDGKNGFSAFTSVLVAKAYPNQPVVHVVAGVDKASIAWTGVPGASGYQIYRALGTTGTYTWVKTITNTTTLKWTNYGMPTGKVYTYKVRAYRVVNGVVILGSFSTPQSVKIL